MHRDAADFTKNVFDICFCHVEGASQMGDNHLPSLCQTATDTCGTSLHQVFAQLHMHKNGADSNESKPKLSAAFFFQTACPSISSAPYFFFFKSYLPSMP